NDELINLYWEHPLLSEDSDEQLEFELSVSTDGGDFKVIATGKDNEYTLSNVKKGSKYTFRVVVIKNELRSDPVDRSIEIPEDKPDPKENKNNNRNNGN